MPGSKQIGRSMGYADTDYNSSIETAKDYIRSAIERVSALIDLFSLSPDSCNMILSDLDNALSYLMDEDLPEMDYDEFVAVAGNSSFDPFDSFEDASGGRSGTDLMVWADEYHDDPDRDDEMEHMYAEMQRLQDELRALKAKQANAQASAFDGLDDIFARSDPYDEIAQQQAAARRAAEQLRESTQPSRRRRPTSRRGAEDPFTAIEPVASTPDIAPAYGAQQPTQVTQATQDAALAEMQATQSIQAAQLIQPVQQTQAQAQSQAAAQAAAQQAQAAAQAQAAQQQMDAERAAKERQRFMTEQQVKRAAATGKKVAVLTPQPSAPATPDTVEVDFDPAAARLGMDIDHVPFCAAEFDVKNASETSSMYVECWNKSIGEWDVGTLLSEEGMEVVEFQISGTLDDGTETFVSWNSEKHTITAQVSADHRIGMLTEATAGTPRQRQVKTARPDISTILEEAPASSAAEALTFLTELNISTIEIDIIYNGNNFALHFSDCNADIEVGWVYDKSITSNELAYLVLYLSEILADYAVAKGSDPTVWNKERVNSTIAGYYHNNKTKYSADVSKARRGSQILLDLSAITVTEEGMLSIKQYSSKA